MSIDILLDLKNPEDAWVPKPADAPSQSPSLDPDNNGIQRTVPQDSGPKIEPHTCELGKEQFGLVQQRLHAAKCSLEVEGFREAVSMAQARVLLRCYLGSIRVLLYCI